MSNCIKFLGKCSEQMHIYLVLIFIYDWQGILFTKFTVHIIKPSLCEKCPNTEFFSGPYFPRFGQHTERYSVSLRFQFECGKILTRKNSIFGHFSRNVSTKIFKSQALITIYWSWLTCYQLVSRIKEHSHCVESVQIRSYFWSVFSCVRTRNNSVFGHFSHSESSL